MSAQNLFQHPDVFLEVPWSCWRLWFWQFTDLICIHVRKIYNKCFTGGSNCWPGSKAAIFFPPLFSSQYLFPTQKCNLWKILNQQIQSTWWRWCGWWWCGCSPCCDIYESFSFGEMLWIRPTFLQSKDRYLWALQAQLILPTFPHYGLVKTNCLYA